MAWAPFGLTIRQTRSFVSGGSACSLWLSSRTESAARSKVIIALLQAPAIDDGRLWLPDHGLFDLGQIGEAAKFGSHGDPVIGLRQDRGLARDGVAENRETIARAHRKGIETVEVAQPRFQRFRQRRPLAQPVREIAGCHF